MALRHQKKKIGTPVTFPPRDGQRPFAEGGIVPARRRPTSPRIRPSKRRKRLLVWGEKEVGSYIRGRTSFYKSVSLGGGKRGNARSSLSTMGGKGQFELISDRETQKGVGENRRSKKEKGVSAVYVCWKSRNDYWHLER